MAGPFSKLFSKKKNLQQQNGIKNEKKIRFVRINNKE